MNGKLFQFERPEPEPEPHCQGEAFCLGCGHEWQALAPVGVTRFECPSCHAMRGLFRYECAPRSRLVRTCDCGNQLFYLTAEGHLCPNCGVYLTYD